MQELHSFLTGVSSLAQELLRKRAVWTHVVEISRGRNKYAGQDQAGDDQVDPIKEDEAHF